MPRGACGVLFRASRRYRVLALLVHENPQGEIPNGRFETFSRDPTEIDDDDGGGEASGRAREDQRVFGLIRATTSTVAPVAIDWASVATGIRPSAQLRALAHRNARTL